MEATLSIEKKSSVAGSSPTGLYIHIPFCANKCPYCDFNSIEGASIPKERYVDALISELGHYIEGGGFSRPLETLYIGGGTPSVLPVASIERLLGRIKGSFDFTVDFEATIEVNPSSVDMEKLQGYKRAGINRVSLGVQSLSDTELNALGRTHSADEARSAFNMVREAGFGSLGIDLIYAIPGQSAAAFKENLERAASLRPEHISIYGLTLEDATPMKEAVESGEVELVTEEVEAKCYELTGEILNEAGYTHYEISNFALPGFESRHNLRYWESSDYLGLGAGAHSCALVSTPGGAKRHRWWNIKDVDEYMSAVEGGGQALAGEESLTHEEERLEALYLGLRLLKGIDIAVFKEKFKVSPIELLGNKAVRLGLIKVDDSGGQGERLRLTPKGLLFSNELF